MGMCNFRNPTVSSSVLMTVRFHFRFSFPNTGRLGKLSWVLFDLLYSVRQLPDFILFVISDPSHLELNPSRFNSSSCCPGPQEWPFP